MLEPSFLNRLSFLLEEALLSANADTNIPNRDLLEDHQTAYPGFIEHLPGDDLQEPPGHAENHPEGAHRGHCGPHQQRAAKSQGP